MVVLFSFGVGKVEQRVKVIDVTLKTVDVVVSFLNLEAKCGNRACVKNDRINIDYRCVCRSRAWGYLARRVQSA